MNIKKWTKNGDQILKCDHIDCGTRDKIWLPHKVRDLPKGLKSHPFCIKCGMVKNIGSDRAVGSGYFINVISRIEKYIKIPGASVRMRLLVKDLEKIEDFEDTYSMSRFEQEKVLINLIKKYYQIPEKTIINFL